MMDFWMGKDGTLEISYKGRTETVLETVTRKEWIKKIQDAVNKLLSEDSQ